MVDVRDFADLVAGSHNARFRARALETFQTGDNPVGEDLDVITGQIDFDPTADIRATGNVGVVSPWPNARDQKLAPFGQEVFLARGIDVGAGGVRWAPLGYFRIFTTAQADAARGPLDLTLEDRMATIIDSRFLQPRQWQPGTTVGDIVEDVVLEVYPNAVIVYDDDSNLAQLGRQLVAEESRYQVLLTLAKGLGKLVFWDSLGRLVFESTPDEDTVLWDVRAGKGGVLVNANRALTRDQVYNAVVAIGEGADQVKPVRAVAFDSSPTSPTVFGGRFGRIPRFFSSPFITTNTQAVGAARNILQTSLGAQYDVSFQAVPNPALRPYDVVKLVYDDGKREQHVVQQVTIPFDNETPVSATTRRSTTIFIGTA